MVVFAMDQRLYDPANDMMALKKVEKIAHSRKCVIFHMAARSAFQMEAAMENIQLD